MASSDQKLDQLLTMMSEIIDVQKKHAEEISEIKSSKLYTTKAEDSVGTKTKTKYKIMRADVRVDEKTWSEYIASWNMEVFSRDNEWLKYEGKNKVHGFLSTGIVFDNISDVQKYLNQKDPDWRQNKTRTYSTFTSYDIE